METCGQPRVGDRSGRRGPSADRVRRRLVRNVGSGQELRLQSQSSARTVLQNRRGQFAVRFTTSTAAHRTMPLRAVRLRTKNIHGIRNSDWFITVFGDGFDPAVDPEDPNIVYSQWQYGGLIRLDRKTGVRIDIKPQPDQDGPALRWNWDSALLISPHSPHRLYYAAQILFRSDDRGDTWKAVSPDLTRNLDRNTLKVMGRVWGVDAVAKNNSTSFYGSIVTVSESPLVEGLLYVGTDDGLVQISEDGGENWRKVEEFETLDVPEYCFCQRYRGVAARSRHGVRRVVQLQAR